MIVSLKLHPKNTLILILFSSINAYYKKKYYLSISQSLIFLTSVLFHHFGIARTLDITVVVLGLFYHIYEHRLSNLFPFFYVIAICCYIIGKIRNSSRWHSLLHVFAVCGNIKLHYHQSRQKL